MKGLPFYKAHYLGFTIFDSILIDACCILGYLGYTSGFSLSCMVFFLISVSPHIHP